MLGFGFEVICAHCVDIIKCLCRVLWDKNLTNHTIKLLCHWGLALIFLRVNFLIAFNSIFVVATSTAQFRPIII